MRVRPRRIEIHVNGQGTGRPDPQRGQEGPAFLDVVADKQEGEEQAEESVEGGAKGHHDPVRTGKTISRNRAAEMIDCKNGRMRRHQKRAPEDGWTDGKEVADVPGLRVLVRQKLTVWTQARLSKIFIGVAPVLFKAKVVLDEWSPRIGVIADAVAVHVGIDEWQGKKEKESEL